MNKQNKTARLLQSHGVRSSLKTMSYKKKKKENTKSSISVLFFEGIAMKGRWFSKKTQATNVSEQKLKP